MAVGQTISDDPLSVPGIRIGTTCAGIKHRDRDDLTLFEITSERATCAAVFTKNAFCAAPVQLAKKHIKQAATRYLLINSGNANAGLGENGLRDAKTCCEALAQLQQVPGQSVLPFSTGVIAEPLPVDKIVAALPRAIDDLAEDHWQAAARAIMTTDTRPKTVSKLVELDGQTITVTGIAKGAGMIQPNMATMLSFIATDARVEAELLQACLTEAVDVSFNCITVDGDTSTNDAVTLVATGAAPVAEISAADDPRCQSLLKALIEVCQNLAESVVRDGEGATKLMRIHVRSAASESEARGVAFTVANSPLVKTALFASDPNWGRILAAIGRAGIMDLDVSNIRIQLGDVDIVEAGQRAPNYTEEQGAAVMAGDEIPLTIDLGRGQSGASVLTCDFSYDYVRINAEYRS